MGEYARIQMAEDARRMFGGEWEPEDFESEPAKAKRPVCPKCGKKFRVHLAVRDHMRDKHAAPITKPVSNEPAETRANTGE